MSELTPNEQQKSLITNTDGLYRVDAGAGTGKTFAVTRRYAEIVKQASIAPEDVLLVTFTRNAAEEMRTRIVDHCQYGLKDLDDAPIQTFHSLCSDLLREYGHTAPQYLDLEGRITGSTQIIENELVEERLFREFIDRFSDDHPDHADQLRALNDPTELLELIGKLAAKGVFPTAEGWYRDGEAHLDGDFEGFRDLFDQANEPRNDGTAQSRLRSRLNKYGQEKLYQPDAPSKAEIRGQGKQVPADVAELAFHQDRTALKSFVHDVYHEYLSFALGRNYLNFGFLQAFAFVLLCEDHTLRESVGFEYVMIDEFQDSSEIQFKLALLLAETDNLCVVGDWKQSIYSFQYADVDNILEFDSRLSTFAAELNRDTTRVHWDTDSVESISLRRNYRSTESILEFSTNALSVPATSREQSDPVDITPLTADTDRDDSVIEAIQHEDEHEAVLAKIQAIVDNDEYLVEDEDGELRPPGYGDITVLTRTRDFGRELLAAASEYDLPVAYEGGIELFHTDEAKLLLAWLRILEYDADRGWAVVLEEAGYLLDEIDAMLDADSSPTYPEEMVAFRAELASMETLGGVARQVFARYGLTGPTADHVLTTVQSAADSTTMTRGDIIRFIERGIEQDSTQEIDAGAGTDSVTVQTIHATKGLEHSIVILANMNQRRFPPSGGGSNTIQFEDPIGLRHRQVFERSAYDLPHVLSDWRMDVLRHCLPRGYDEERRLLYVAITRAKRHLVFAAGENPNAFLEALPVDVETIEPDVSHYTGGGPTRSTFTMDVLEPAGPTAHTPHTLMSAEPFEDVEGGMGTEYGTQVHDFAEAYARDRTAAPTNEDERRVAAFLDSLSGELLVEEDATLPLSVDGERVTISGVVDLLHVTPERVDIVDYKTDRGRHGEDEYRTQLSVYYHVVQSVYPEREIRPSIFYTATGDRVEIDPLSLAELWDVVRDREE
ncbi:UvrD-helicase domain-containing protein [Halobaculum sp. EA56]|uniref:UvrD-helicase domain-containing protein n=1 Tax=Halobaculum sp. EA56 TaxID=3421648 RepID=UPI003EBA37CD